MLVKIPLREFSAHSDFISSIVFSQDLQYVISGSFDKTIRIWELGTGRLLKVLEGHVDCVNSLAISQDNKYIVSGSKDKTVRIWELETGKLVDILEGHTAAISSVVLSQNSKYIISGGLDKKILVWDMTSRRLERVLEGHQDLITTIAVSPDDKYIISGSNDKTIRVWELSTGKLLKKLEVSRSYISSLVISPDNKDIIFADSNSIQVWDVQSGKFRKRLEGDTQVIFSIAITSDGKYLVSGSETNKIHLWDLSSCKIKQTFIGNNSPAFTVTISRDNRFVATGGVGCSIILWDLKTTKSIRTLGGPSSAINSIAISSNGFHVITGNQDNTIRVLDLRTGSIYQTLKGHKQAVTSVFISSDNRFIASGSWDRTVRLWDFSTGQLRKTLKGHTRIVTSVAISSDCRVIISASSDKSIRIWDLRTGELIKLLKGHDKSINSIVISSDNKYIISGSDDKTVRLWDLSTGKLLKTLEGHVGPINSVKISENNIYIRSKDLFGTSITWDISSGKPLSHPNEVSDLTFFPNTSSLEGNASIYPLAENLIITVSSKTTNDAVRELVQNRLEKGFIWIAPFANSYLLTESHSSRIKTIYETNLKKMYHAVSSREPTGVITEKQIIYELLKILRSPVDGTNRASARTVSRRLGLTPSEIVPRICDLIIEQNPDLKGIIHDAGDPSTDDDDVFILISEKERITRSKKETRKYVQLRRLKVFVVGEPGVGKTALKNALTGILAEGPLASTSGIDTFLLWDKFEDDTQWGIYWWDFAGQRSNRDTHKIFLTQDAIYLLVMNLRDSIIKNDVGYWLQSIRDKAPKAPIIPILTHLDEVGSEVLGLESHQEWKKIEKLFKTFEVRRPIKVSNRDGTNIDKVKKVIEQLLNDTSATVLPSIYLDIERYILDKKNEIFLPVKQIVCELKQHFGSDSDYSDSWTYRSLKIMARQGLALLLENTSIDDIMIIDVDKANKSIAKIIDQATAKKGYLSNEDILLSCTDFFEPSKRQEAVSIITNLMVDSGLGIPVQSHSQSTVLIVPHATDILDENEALGLTPELFHDLKRNKKYFSCLCFLLDTYDEILPSRLLGQLGFFIPINESTLIWHEDPQGLELPTEMKAILFQGQNPSIMFHTRHLPGKLELNLYTRDPILAQIIYQGLIYTFGSLNIQFKELEVSIHRDDQTNDKIVTTLLQQIIDEITINREKITIESQTILSKIDSMNNLLLSELDKITNKCPRLVFLEPDRIGRLTGRILTRYSLVIACEKCYQKYIVKDSHNKPISFSLMNEDLSRCFSALGTVSQILAHIIPGMSLVAGLTGKKLIKVPIPKERLAKIQQLSESTSKIISEISQARASSTAILRRPTEPVETCEVFESLDPERYYRNILSKDPTSHRWVCSSCRQ